jgi:hypothetical protein
MVNELKKEIKFQDKEIINTTSTYKIAGENKFVVEA